MKKLNLNWNTIKDVFRVGFEVDWPISNYEKIYSAVNRATMVFRIINDSPVLYFAI